MANEINQARFAIVSSIERILSDIFPDYLHGERRNLSEEVNEWARNFARDRDFEAEAKEKNEPVRRSIVTIKGKRSYVIAIHDPLGRVSPKMLPAESITGADYVVEFPVTHELDKLVLVQLRTTKYGMPPKQYFGMGTFYVYAHYLGGEWFWNSRFLSGAEYVTKGKRPHKEFLFVKIIGKDIYIPLSSVLRTFKPQTYTFASSMSPSSPKIGDARYKETATFADFSNMSHHLTEYYVGLLEFMKAADACQIGFDHPSTAADIRKKMNSLFFLSEMLLRPNIAIVELSNHLLPQIVSL